MASRIKHKRSSVAGKIPVAGDLEAGELALNSNDGKVFLKKDDNSILDITSTIFKNDTSVTVTDTGSNGAITSVVDGNTVSSFTSNHIGFTQDTSVANAKELQFKELTANGINYVGVRAPDNLAGNYTLKLPTATGALNQTLVTNGSGQLLWADADSFGGNRIYVSNSKGDDANDGVSAPVKTLKRALQLASAQVYTALGIPNGQRFVVSVAAGDYYEDNPIIIPDNVSVCGDSLRACIVRPLNANQDMFRVRNGCYFTEFTFRDALSAGIPSFTFNYAVAFDDPLDTTVSRVGYTYLSNDKPTIHTSPYIQNCSIISFLGGNGVLVDGSKVDTPNTPPVAIEAENPVVGATPQQGKSMVANAFTMLSFGGTGWRIINDAYSQIVSCFQIFLLNGVYTQSGGYCSITNSATNFGLYALRASGYSPLSFDFDRGYIGTTGSFQGYQTITAFGFTRPQGPVEHFIVRVIDPVFTYDVAKCERDVGYIIDAVRYDMMFGGNFRALSAGRLYLLGSASVVTTAQKDITINSYIYLKGILAGYVSDNPTALDRVNSAMNLIIGIIADPEEALANTNLVDPTGYNTGYFNARRLVVANKNFLKAEIAAWLNVNQNAVWSALSSTVKAEWQADVGYIVDGLAYDLTYGGNLESVVAGRNSVGFTLSGSQKTAILAAYAYLKSIVDDVAQAVSITPSAGNGQTQDISGTAGSSGAAVFAQDRIQDIYDTINTGIPVADIAPSTVWVSDGDLIVKNNTLVTNTATVKTQVSTYASLNGIGADLTDSYKTTLPAFLEVSFNAATAVTTGQAPSGGIFTINTHGFLNGAEIIYSSEGNTDIGGLFNGDTYFVKYIDANSFTLCYDDSLSRNVRILSVSSGTHKFRKQDYQVVVNERLDSHNVFQDIVLTPGVYSFTASDVLEGVSNGLPNAAYVYSYDAATYTLTVCVNEVTINSASVRNVFLSTGSITKINATVVSIALTSASRRFDLYGSRFSVTPTVTGGAFTGTGTLPGKKVHFHRPSITNSSGHTWEYAGSGIDYNALPQNGGQTQSRYEQYRENAGRVYSSGTNELGDFKVGDFITAFNRTGNITFRNKVTVDTLDVLRLALSNIEITGISTDVDLGENEVGGPSDARLSTQLAMWSYANNRLGSFIDKTVTTAAIPGSIVQLNSNGQINSDLIPTQRNFTSFISPGYGSRLTQVDNVPAGDMQAGDIATENFHQFELNLSGSLGTAFTDGSLVVQAVSGATGYLKGDYASSATTIIVASIYEDFTVNFTTGAGNTLTIASTATGAYPTLATKTSQSPNYFLRNATTSQYLIIPNTGSVTFTLATISKAFVYNNYAYITTTGSHSAVTGNQVRVNAVSAAYDASPFVTVTSSTEFYYPQITASSTASATTTATATLDGAASAGTMTGSVPAASLTGTITVGDYVFDAGGTIPKGSKITTVNMAVDPRTFTVTFPSNSTVASTNTATLSFFTPATESGTVKSVATAADSLSQGEVQELRAGVLTAVNSLTLVPGSGYVAGIYRRVPLTNVTGSGSGALADLTVSATGAVTDIDLVFGGTGYVAGSNLSANNANLGGSGSGFQITTTAVERRAYLRITGGQLFVATPTAPDFIEEINATKFSITSTNSTVFSFNALPTGSGGDVNYLTNEITLVGHGFSSGDPVTYSPGVNPSMGGLVTGNVYYVKVIGVDTIQLCSTFNVGSVTAAPFGASSTGTHTLTRYAINLTDNSIYAAAHSLITGDAVRVTSLNMPTVSTGAIPDQTRFFVGSVTTNSFTLHELRADALLSVNGNVTNSTNIDGAGSGTLTFVKQNVQVTGTVNTSSTDRNNWNSLVSSNIDASNIISGIISPSRLASGTANTDTFLRGDSTWATAVKSVAAAALSPITILGSGSSPFYGAVTVDIIKADKTGGAGGYSSLGAASFNLSQFAVGTGDAINAGEVYIKSGVVDAGTLDNLDSSYFLNPANLTSSVPVNRGGTGIGSYAVGDTVFASGTTTFNTLNIGISDSVMTSSGTAPQWSTGLTLARSISLTGPYVTTTSTSAAAVFNTGSKVLNAGGDATSVSIGSNSASESLTTNVKSYTTGGSSTTSVTVNVGLTLTIGSIARNGSNVATITTTANHGLTTGDTVTVVCGSDSTFDARNISATVTGLTTFTYSNTGSTLLTTLSSGSVYVGATALALTTTVTSGATALVFAATTGVRAGMLVQGSANIPGSTTVTGVNGTTVYLSAATTGTITASTSIVFTDTNTSLGIKVGDQITLAGAGVPDLIGTWPVTSAGAASATFTIKTNGSVTAANLTKAGTVVRESTLVIRNRNVTIGSSEASATPVSAVIKGENGVGTNIAGASITVRPGLATGNATSGSINFQSGTTGSSGDVTQTSTTRMSLDPSAAATTLDLTTAMTTANVFNTNATTVNFAGASTTLALANNGTSARTINVATAATGGASTLTFGGAVTGNTIKLSGTTSGTINHTTDVTTGTVNLYTGVTGTINIGATTSTIRFGTVNINNQNYISSSETTGVTSVSAVAVDTFALATFRSGKYTLTVTCTAGTDVNQYQTSEILILHDGTTATITDYAVIRTGNNLVTFTATINGANVELRAQATTGNTVKVRVVRHLNTV